MTVMYPLGIHNGTKYFAIVDSRGNILIHEEPANKKDSKHGKKT